MSEQINNQYIERYASLLIKKINQIGDCNYKTAWITSSFVGCCQNLEGRPYANNNQLLLSLLSETEGYKTPVFVTFLQAEKNNIKILKGSKSFPVIYADYQVKNIFTGDRITMNEYKNLSEITKQNYQVFSFHKHYNVFNLDQTNFSDKYPDRWDEIVKDYSPDFNNVSDNYSIPILDSIIKNQSWLCPIHSQAQNKAYYSPLKDIISVPLKDQFPSGKDFYYTTLHEMAHSTGHSSRLDRFKPTSFGSKDRAHEELIAELSSAIIGKTLKMDVEPQKDCAIYIKLWLTKLSDNPKYILSILQDVGKSCNMIENGLQTEKESFSANGSIDSYTKSLRCDNGQYQIFDRLTGKSHSLDCGEIDMSKLTGNQVKSLLNGNDVPFGSGQKLSLVKTTGGFALSVGKQVVSLADAEAGL